MGKNKNYERGRRFEYEVMEIFRRAGFITLRTAGSHGFADVVLVKLGPSMDKIAHVAFVQCKTEKKKKYMITYKIEDTKV